MIIAPLWVIGLILLVLFACSLIFGPRMKHDAERRKQLFEERKENRDER